MIDIKYQGGLGNVMFQYCFGKILAIELGYKLNAKPIFGFPQTQIPVNGVSYNNDSVILSGHNVDIPALIGNNLKMVLEQLKQRATLQHDPESFKQL